MTDYDERLQREKNDSSYHIMFNVIVENFTRVSVDYEPTRDFVQ